MSTDNLYPFTRRAVLGSLVGVLAGCMTNNTAEDNTGSTDESPKTIDGLKLWLHPDSGMIKSDGLVETWEDDSGNGYDFTQETDGIKPKLVKGGANGKDALRFDGEDDRLIRRDTLDIPNDSGRTFIVVCRLSDLKARSPYLTQGKFNATGSESNSYGLEANTFRTAGNRFGLYLISSAKDSKKETNTRYNLHILRTSDFSSLSAIENSTTYYINGEKVSFTSTPGGTRNTQFKSDSTAIGSFPQSSPSTVMHGDIAEICVYDRALKNNERISLEEQLLTKYDI